jgi:hypothetical protein
MSVLPALCTAWYHDKMPAADIEAFHNQQDTLMGLAGCVPSFSQLHPYSLRQKLSHALLPEKFARGELLIRQVRD